MKKFFSNLWQGTKDFVLGSARHVASHANAQWLNVTKMWRGVGEAWRLNKAKGIAMAITSTFATIYALGVILVAVSIFEIVMEVVALIVTIPMIILDAFFNKLSSIFMGREYLIAGV